MRFSPSTLGFYPSNVAYPNAPGDLTCIPDELWRSLRGKQLDVDAHGMPCEKGVPPPTMEERAAALLAKVDEHLNAAANAKGYDSIVTAALRAALPNSPFHLEGVAFGEWMDATYAKCYEVLALVTAGAMAEPDWPQLQALLPPLVLPAFEGA